MTDSFVIRWVGRACLSVLLLIAMFSSALADDPRYSKLTFGDGKEYQTAFYDAHLLGKLRRLVNVSGQGQKLKDVKNVRSGAG